jgi:hypothetical protein
VSLRFYSAATGMDIIALEKVKTTFLLVQVGLFETEAIAEVNMTFCR